MATRCLAERGHRMVVTGATGAVRRVLVMIGQLNWV
jgi:hypothetical protein